MRQDSAIRNVFTLTFILTVPTVVQASSYIMHTKKMASTCAVQESSVMSDELQHEICRQWTRNKPIDNWNMSAWETITDPYDTHLLERRLHILPGQKVLFTSISYTTNVKLPSILEKIININLSIGISKHLFIYNNKVYSFVHIQNVPLVGYLTISNVATMIGRENVLSNHMITHGNIPWFAKWASEILKKEIIKSVDTYDQTCLKVYCDFQSAAPV